MTEISNEVDAESKVVALIALVTVYEANEKQKRKQKHKGAVASLLGVAG